jgi:hypothetical protein
MTPIAYPLILDAGLTKERICNEELGLCSKPVIEEISIKSVVDNMLKDKPVQI